MYCSDFSPRNVDYRAELVKIRWWHSALGVDYESLQPRFLSPEMRQIYANWALGREEEIAPVNLGAAGVFSVAMLALSLLSPATTQGVLAYEALDEVLRGVVLTEGLKKVLEGMLVRAVEQRISLDSALKLVELLSADSALLTVPTLNDLVRENQLKEAFIALTIAKELNLHSEVKYICSNCESLIFTSEPLAVSYCPKHLFCSIQCYSAACTKAGKADNSLCPLCESKPSLRRVRIQPKPKSSIKLCQTCQREFEPNTTDPWRLDLLGSSLFPKAQSVCSQACMRHPSEAAKAPDPEIRPHVDSCYNPAMSAFVKSIPIYNARSRVIEDTYGQLDTESQQELLLSAEMHNQKMMKKIFAPDERCHICRKELRNLIPTRLIICSQMPTVVCSVACLRGRTDSNCPCGGEVDSASVASALGEGDPFCQSCGAQVEQRPVCGHSFCRRCMLQMESCAECIRGGNELVNQVQQLFLSLSGRHP
jgi:hypothetical protein